MKWLLREANSAAVAELQTAGLSPLLSRLLVLRGIVNHSSAQRFLQPPLTDLHDPADMADMAEAVRLIVDASLCRRHEFFRRDKPCAIRLEIHSHDVEVGKRFGRHR